MRPAASAIKDFAARDSQFGVTTPPVIRHYACMARRGLAQIEGARRIGGSADRTTVLETADGQVCKVFHGDRIAAAAEVAALRLLERQAAVPAPQLLSEIEDEDTFYVFMTRLPGVLPAMTYEELSSPPGLSLQREQGRVVASMHTIQPGAFGRPPRRSLVSAIDHLEETADKRARGASDTRSTDLVQKVRSHQERWISSIATSRRPVLVHGDVGLGNLLFRTPEPPWTLTGVIDWETASGGIPAEDLAWKCLYGFDHPCLHAFLDGYRDVTPIEAATTTEEILYGVASTILAVWALAGQRRANAWLLNRADAMANDVLSGVKPVWVRSPR